MFVGQTGIGRIIQKTVERMAEGDPRQLGVIPLDIIQRSINLWYSLSLDLFGGEDSSNAATFFGAGLKGRDRESFLGEHTGLDQMYQMKKFGTDGAAELVDVPLRRAMNEVLRDAYVEDCEKVIKSWNRIIQKGGVDIELTLPSRRFHRNQGIYAGMYFDLQGNFISREAFEAKRHAWLPTDADRGYVQSLMTAAITEPGVYADWISPPRSGINRQPIDFEYVKFCR